MTSLLCVGSELWTFCQRTFWSNVCSVRLTYCQRSDFHSSFEYMFWSIHTYFKNFQSTIVYIWIISYVITEFFLSIVPKFSDFQLPNLVWAGLSWPCHVSVNLIYNLCLRKGCVIQHVFYGPFSRPAEKLVIYIQQQKIQQWCKVTSRWKCVLSRTV